MASNEYDQRFYDEQRDLSRRSAAEVVPLLMEMVEPTSVVDVGCGVGTWLRAFVDRGITDVTGVEGAHIHGVALEIDQSALAVADLGSGALELPRSYDLALCMEVAEHLPPAAARGLVRSLTALAPVVLFGAGVPSQGGDGHVNEQWQQWWSDRFAAEGYVAFDVIRPRIWANPNVAWWYAQNTILYARQGDPVEERLSALPSVPPPLSMVHPAMLLERVAAAEQVGAGASLRLLVAALRRAIERRLRRGRGTADAPNPVRHTTLERAHDLG